MHVTERFPLPAHEYISLQDASCCPWSLRVHAHHHRTRTAAIFDCDGLEPEAEVAARDAAVLFKSCRYPFDCGKRNGDDPLTRAEHHHAHSLAAAIHRETAFGGWPQAHVKLNARIDLAAA